VVTWHRGGSREVTPDKRLFDLDRARRHAVFA
jgi:hypothetical protein